MEPELVDISLAMIVFRWLMSCSKIYSRLEPIIGGKSVLFRGNLEVKLVICHKFFLTAQFRQYPL